MNFAPVELKKWTRRSIMANRPTPSASAKNVACGPRGIRCCGSPGPNAYRVARKPERLRHRRHASGRWPNAFPCRFVFKAVVLTSKGEPEPRASPSSRGRGCRGAEDAGGLFKSAQPGRPCCGPPDVPTNRPAGKGPSLWGGGPPPARPASLGAGRSWPGKTDPDPAVGV